ncbi:hypothetical protein [Acidomonas methanolica]|uniref:hypothetical protein n=1 Tax=Acidomonas methanolica TaxID=437 RepID=UPI00211A594F|nr:hypothetical protein [Acidomonas methanolica]MCQ9155797.1 hypothetical protein [Acidomonas methanolica]
MSRLRMIARFAPFFLTAPLALTACEEQQSAFAPACPHLDMLGDASDLFAYDGRGLDVGDLVAHASLTGMTGACEAGPTGEHHQRTVRTRISLAMTIQRGPAAAVEALDLPYFVAVVRNGKILDKKVFHATAAFEPNTSLTAVNTPIRIIDLPASDSIEDTDYHMVVGFQLTRAQLQYNRTHLPQAHFREHLN